MSKHAPSNVKVGDKFVSPKPEAPTSSPATPQHAAHRYHTVLLAAGVAFIAIGALALTTLGDPNGMGGAMTALSAACVAFGSLLTGIGVVGRQVGSGVQHVNTSFDLIARGRFTDAEKILDEVERTNTNRLVRSVSSVQRGLIAMRRGDAKTGLEHLDRAIATKPGLFYRSSVRVQTINALGIRAFLRAVTGDREGVRVDIKTLRESPDALPQALARAALAEAICIEREGDRDALRKHLAAQRDLLFDVTDRRERAIVRAFQRMLETTATSVYRTGAKLDMHGDEPPLTDWVAQLVPAAAPFVEAPTPTRATNDLPVAVASDDAKKAVTNAREKARKNSTKGSTNGLIPAMGVILLGAVIAWLKEALEIRPYIEGPNGHERLAPWEWADYLQVIGATYALVFGALMGRRLWLARQANQETQRLFAAMNLSAQGKLDEAKESLAKLSESRFAFVKAQAYLALAYIAERRADLASALEHCDRGIASLSQYVLRISASDILLPDLMSQRAFVLAAMDRHDEAEAELAALPPAYPYRSRALLRVRLISHTRRGDLVAAAKLASETNLDLPLSARDELLADGICAAITPESVGAGELPRIRRELRTVPALRPWLATVAPTALEAIENATDDEPLAKGHADDSTAVAEAEAHAEAEAAREEASLRRAARMS